VRDSARSGYTLASLVTGVVESVPFQYRQVGTNFGSPPSVH